VNAHQSIAIQALEQMKGDDLARATLVFKDMTPAQMKGRYGMSGKTRQQIIDEYKAHDARIDAAIEWVKGQKE
jgi:hypothetical protein